jgi:type IV secretion system protein VirB8
VDKQHEPLAESVRWEAVVEYQNGRYRRLCLGVASGAIAWAAASFMAPRLWPEPPRVEPRVVIVNPVTGEQRFLESVTARTIPAEEAIAKNRAEAFVMAREGYSWDFLQRDHDTVRAMATAAVFEPYDRQFAGENAIDKKRRNTELHRIEIVSLRPTGEVPDGSKEIVVTYDKTVGFGNRGLPPVTTRHVATLHYTWQPDVQLEPKLRTRNPLGFAVIAYRSDPVMAGVPLAQGGQVQ